MDKKFGYGARIRAARAKKKMNQETLAQLSGLGDTNSLISQYETENSEPSLRNFAAMAKPLEVDPAALAFEFDEGSAELLRIYRRAQNGDREALLGFARHLAQRPPRK